MCSWFTLRKKGNLGESSKYIQVTFHIKIEKKEKVLDHASITEIDATPDTRSCQVIEQLIKVV